MGEEGVPVRARRWVTLRGQQTRNHRDPVVVELREGVVRALGVVRAREERAPSAVDLVCLVGWGKRHRAG